MSEKLLVIDGHSMAFRAFFALPAESFTAAGGQHTNAVYGFLSMLVKLLDTEKPDRIAVAFDASRESFRTEIYPEYKGTRDSSPPEFEGQVQLIEAVLDKMGVKTITVPNFEADDVLATLATEGKARGMDVLIASGDRDTFQLVNDKVTVLYPGRSTSDLNYMTPEAVEAKYAVTPARYPELAALVGETSDNLPGIPGVGPKTAAQWLNKFDGLDPLLSRADEVGGKRGEALREHVEDVRRNRRLNALVTDMSLGLTPEQCNVDEPDLGGLGALFDTLEFGQLRGRILKAMAPLWGGAEGDLGTATGPDGETALEEEGVRALLLPDEVVVISSESDLEDVLGELAERDVALWGTGRLAPTDARLDLLALATADTVIVVDSADLSPSSDLAIAEFLRTHTRLIVHGGKALAHGLAAQGWELSQPRFDTELAAYLCNPNQRDYGLLQTSQIYLGATEVTEDDGAMFSVDEARGGAEIDSEGATPSQNAAALNAVTVLALHRPLENLLDAREALRLLVDIEIPTSMILFDMSSPGSPLIPPSSRSCERSTSSRPSVLQPTRTKPSGTR